MANQMLSSVALLFLFGAAMSEPIEIIAEERMFPNLLPQGGNFQSGGMFGLPSPFDQMRFNPFGTMSQSYPSTYPAAGQMSLMRLIDDFAQAAKSHLLQNPELANTLNSFVTQLQQQGISGMLSKIQAYTQDFLNSSGQSLPSTYQPSINSPWSPSSPSALSPPPYQQVPGSQWPALGQSPSTPSTTPTAIPGLLSPTNPLGVTRSNNPLTSSSSSRPLSSTNPSDTANPWANPGVNVNSGRPGQANSYRTRM